eukprot:gnl/MRDRNA2_/MRDRNA2_95442_c0_seq1.p1 gnl/MRDRNA2_/MRDRNA2_95442_c0~~gnl/MRDRNA2_/MRDRNA2_95442_c0_seq1.p1  ORF type:complete len:206 (+),score=38.41 gnl/MRDRNA2_/MRDRNA2_95442_c0_seq1:99-716(+)
MDHITATELLAPEAGYQAMTCGISRSLVTRVREAYRAAVLPAKGNGVTDSHRATVEMQLRSQEARRLPIHKDEDLGVRSTVEQKITVEQKTTSLAAPALVELAHQILEQILDTSISGAVMITRGPIAPPDVVALYRGEGEASEKCHPALVVWLMLDPLDIDSKQTTFVKQGTHGANAIFKQLYKMALPASRRAEAKIGTLTEIAE